MRKTVFLARLIATIMLCTFILPAISFAEGGTPFKDVPADADRDYKYSLNSLYDQGIFEGRGDGIFGFGDNINRAEISTVVSRILQLNTWGVDLSQNPFVDVDVNEWYGPYIMAAFQNNIMHGDDFGGTFRPGDPILDVEALAVVTRLFGKDSQIQQTSPWYQGYVDFANSNELIRTPLSFSTRQITREDFALLIYRFQQKFDSQVLIDFGGLPFPAGTTDTAAIAPFTPTGAKKTWTFMVYQNGDNNLEPFAISDLNEMETVGSNSNLNIVSQIDRTPGYDASNGDWEDTKRYLVTSDNNLDTISSQAVGTSYEANMASAQDLANFIEWSVTNYPADHYALVLWNHGGTWFTASNDETDNMNGMTIMGIANALDAVTTAGNFKFDVVGFDMCLMGQLEVASEIAPYASYMVSSEEFEPGDGWPYHTILPDFKTNPNITGRELAENIVDKYYESYEGSTSEGLATVSALDLSTMSNLESKFNNLAKELRKLDATGMKTVNAIRKTIPEFSSDGGFKSFDLYQFAKTAANVTTLPSGVTTAAGALVSQIETSVIAMKNGPAFSSAGGISFYFPPAASVPQEYSTTNLAAVTEWDEFLSQDFQQKLSQQIQNVPPTVSLKSTPRSKATSKTTRGRQIDETVYDFSGELNSYGTIDVPFTTNESISDVYFFVGAYAPSSYGDGYVYSIIYTEELIPTQTGLQLSDGTLLPLWESGVEYSYSFDGYIPVISNGSTYTYAPLESLTPGSQYKSGLATLNSEYGAAEYCSPILSSSTGKVDSIALFGNLSGSSYIAVAPPAGGTVFYYQPGVNEYGESVYFPATPLTIGSSGLYESEKYIPNGFYTIGVIGIPVDESEAQVDFRIGETLGSAEDYTFSTSSMDFAITDPILADEYYVQSYLAYDGFNYVDPYLYDETYDDVYLTDDEFYQDLLMYFMQDFQWYCENYGTVDSICTPYLGWTQAQWDSYWASISEEEFLNLYFEFYWADYFCETDADCYEGEYCSGGMCIYGGAAYCYSDADCLPGTYCENGLCMSSDYGSTYSVSGMVSDATTGYALSNVYVYVDGYSDIYTYSDSNGNFTLSNVPSGYVTLYYSTTGYYDLSQMIYVDDYLGTLSASLSPEFGGTPETQGELRIVLTWGVAPSDLDSHLIGPDNYGSTFHIYYAWKDADNVRLDTDDTSSYGPETVTIYDVLNTGKYLYYVNNFSGTGTFAGSDAVVNIYDSTGLIATYNVPESSGNYWSVFEIDTAGNINPINTTSDYIDTSSYNY